MQGHTPHHSHRLVINGENTIIDLCWDAIAACASDRASSLYLHLAVEVVAALRCDAQVCGRAVDELPRQRPPAVATPTLFC